MHVLFTTAATIRPRGGSEYLWLATAARLANAGIQVTAAVEWEPNASRALNEIREAGGKVMHLPTTSPRRPAWWRAGWHLGIVAAPDHFAWLDHPHRPDLVIYSACVHSEPANIARACQTRNIPYALIIQAATPIVWPDDDGIDTLTAAYLGASANWFVSAANQELVERILANSVPRATIVRNPFNVNYDARPPWPNSNAGWKIACVARLELQAKAHDVLFKALASPKWRDRPITLTIYGHGCNERSIRRLAALYHLTAVQFAGYTNNILEIWAEHHALVLPSRAEGLPLAVVEAMLCGRPCIVVDEGGSAELLVDNETGFVAAAATPTLLDEALERAWVRREEWRAIGGAASDAVRKQVPPDPVAILTAHIQSLCNNLAAK